jgi:hypothetical protein
MGATSVTERLTKTVRDAGVTLEDFGRLANEEVIRLSRKWKIGDWRESRIERDWIDYTDTAETNAMRDDMRRVNAWRERNPPTRTAVTRPSVSERPAANSMEADR